MATTTTAEETLAGFARRRILYGAVTTDAAFRCLIAADDLNRTYCGSTARVLEVTATATGWAAVDYDTVLGLDLCWGCDGAADITTNATNELGLL